MDGLLYCRSKIRDLSTLLENLNLCGQKELLFHKELFSKKFNVDIQEYREHHGSRFDIARTNSFYPQLSAQVWHGPRLDHGIRVISYSSQYLANLRSQPVLLTQEQRQAARKLSIPRGLGEKIHLIKKALIEERSIASKNIHVTKDDRQLLLLALKRINFKEDSMFYVVIEYAFSLTDDVIFRRVTREV